MDWLGGQLTFEVLFWATLVAIIAYLVYRRYQDSKSEDFEKRDN